MHNIEINTNGYPVPLQDYKVLVKCTTFNQAKYIEDSLHGFEIQQTSFPFVCVIIDDASTDGEQRVLYSWMNANCEMTTAQRINIPTSEIIIVKHKTNQNCTFAFYLLKQNLWKEPVKKEAHVRPWQAKCKYVAFCEGDDYWTNKMKLQLQVDFLDNHLDYTCTFHNALIKYENQKKSDRLLNTFKQGTFKLCDIVKNWHISLASYILKTDVLSSNELKLLENVSWGSYTLLLAAAMQGKTYGFSEAMSVYRKNEGGITNHLKESDSIKRHFAMMEVIADKDAIKENENRKAKWIAERGFLSACFGKKDAIEGIKIIFNHNKMIVIRGIALFPYYTFVRVVKRIMS